MAVTRAIAAVGLLAVVAAAARVDAGHESPFYPSFYPHEIHLESVSPAAAAGLLRQASIHAFVGADPFDGRSVPGDVAFVESLGSYVVLTLNTAVPALRGRAARCALSSRLGAMLARRGGAFVLHPYPVTPYHADYLEHYDLAESAKQRILRGPDNAGSGGRVSVRLSATGALAEHLARALGPISTAGWDARVETIDVGELIAAHAASLNGWQGPPWIKAGWYNAYLALGGTIVDPSTRAQVDRILHRLVDGEYHGSEEKANLERTFVSLLGPGCERAVIGYTVRRTFFNTEFSKGVQNVAYDSLEGVTSPIFIRTVKLKDFMWNGWLRIGIAGRPGAAWNPVGGFGDAFGRLLWAAVSDPALLPGPYNDGWIANRVDAETWEQLLQRLFGSGTGNGGVLSVPPDAVVPQAGSGGLEPVGADRRVRERVEYRVLASSFHDGTAMTAADVLYAYVFASHWGGRASGQARAGDPLVERSTESMRRALAGIKVLTTQRVVKDLGGDLKLTYDVPVIDVYVNQGPADPQQVAAIAPPWSTVPWHLLALMEEGVQRGVGAFSQEEAGRRGVAWLDLVRDQGTRTKLAAILDDLAARSYVPDALKRWVTPADARRRWSALREFYRTYGHFLVTNGPYRLKRWSGSGVTLEAFRDLSYPLGVGSFDKHALPRRAYITGIDLRGDRLEVRPEVERVIKYQRSYEIVRERLGSNTSGAIDTPSAVCRFVVVRADGQVVKSATAHLAGPGVYGIDLREGLGPGAYSIQVAVFLDDNQMNPEIKSVGYRRP